MGNFPIFPIASCTDDDLTKCKFAAGDRAVNYTQGSVKARPGFFGLSLNTSVQAEMTVTNRSALYRFSFPDGSNSSPSPLVLLDLRDLPDTRQRASASVDPVTGRITASGSFSPSFGEGTYSMFVCADFKGASVRDTGIYRGNVPDTNTKAITATGSASSSPAGAFVRFQSPTDHQILGRVGVSFISTDKACTNAETEQPDFAFDNTVEAAENTWRAKLNVIEIDATGVSEDLQKVFWSGTYRTQISPQDYTGENPLWSSTEPYYDSFYWLASSFLML